MFELRDPFPVKIERISLPAKKLGKEIRHLTDIVVSFEGRNTLLDLFDPKFLPMFYRKVESHADQAKLDLADDVELPVLVSTALHMPIRLALEYVGYRAVIDRGLGGKISNIEIDEMTIKSIQIWLKEGGSLRGTMHLQSANVSTSQVGKLRDFLKLDTKLCLIAPEVPMDAEFAEVPARAADIAKRRGRPPKNATAEVTPFPGPGKGAKKPPTTKELAEAATAEFQRLHDTQQLQ